MPNYRAMAIAAAKRHGISPNIFLKQINQESGFNPRARSSAGALGIAQFMPGTARGYHINPMNPAQALDAAARMDASGLKQYGTWQRTLSAYNSGNPDAYLNPGFAHGQTTNYVRSILSGSKVPVPKVGSSPLSAPASPLRSPQQGSGTFKDMIAASLLQAASDGGQFAPGALLGLVAARKQAAAAEQTYGPGGAASGSGLMEGTHVSQGHLPILGDTKGLNGSFLARVSTAVRGIGGTKVKITSGYRSPAHNKAVGGAPNSNHMYGHALDGYAYFPRQGWVPIGKALAQAAPKYGLRSGASFNWGGAPDIVHVDDGYNQHR